MRIRIPFASAFLFLLLGSAYLGLTSIQIPTINDKVLHFLTFFVLTLCFYWIIDGSRRRTLNFTLVAVTFLLGVGSEVLQGLLPNKRIFDPFDILANIVGSLSALAICSWYHKRMLERKRLSKYHIVPGSDGLGEDVELGEGSGSQQEVGVTGPVDRSLEEQLDSWDENADDPWDEDLNGEEEAHGTESGSGEGGPTPSSGSAGDDVVEAKK